MLQFALGYVKIDWHTETLRNNYDRFVPINPINPWLYAIFLLDVKVNGDTVTYTWLGNDTKLRNGQDIECTCSVVIVHFIEDFFGQKEEDKLARTTVRLHGKGSSVYGCKVA